MVRVADGRRDAYRSRKVHRPDDSLHKFTGGPRHRLLKIEDGRPEVLKALLPWLENPKWLRADIGGRGTIVQALTRIKEPEGVPGLIVALDEKEQRPASDVMANAANAAANAANAAANAAATAANRLVAASNLRGNSNAASNSYAAATETYFALRYSAITALAFQKDSRAVPALRRVLNEQGQSSDNQSVVGAIFECGGFSIAEQVDALEYVATSGGQSAGPANVIANVPGYTAERPRTPNIKELLGLYISLKPEVDEDLARAVIDRIGKLDKSDPPTAAILRSIVTQWPR